MSPVTGAEFREQQCRALDYPGNVAVSAGAGSGKTRVLVEKYFRLLADEHPNWPVHSVVAITFTVKAASELRTRIVKRIRSELSQADLDSTRRRRLIAMRRLIASAPIGTIHQYCGRILRQYSVEAGLDPDFTIIEGVREAAMRRDAVQAAIDRAAASAPDSGSYRDLLLLLTLYSRRDLFRLVDSMVRRRAEFRSVAAHYSAQSLEGLYAELETYHGTTVLSERARAFDEFSENARGVAASLSNHALSAPVLRALRPFRERDTPVDPAAEWVAARDLMGAVVEAFFTREGTLRKKVSDAGFDEETLFKLGRLQQIDSRVRDGSMDELKPPDRESLEIARMLCGLFMDAEKTFGRVRSAAFTMDSSDLLDFADLELRACELLRSDASVRERLRDSTRFLIMDEFQDTSQIQWRILSSIVCDECGRMLPSRFFMVGDAKQSIYGFRRAETGMFRLVRDLVTASNGFPGEQGGAIPMFENFRTLPAPLGFVNALFRSLMDGGLRDGASEYEPLVGRRSEAPGHVELLVVRPASARKDNGDAEQDEHEEESLDEVEAEAIALRIRDLIREGKAAAGDFAILFRKRKHFPAFEAALRTSGLPFVTHRGKGLYEQEEVAALIALLRTVVTPDDDYSVAEWLRGPFINLTDDTLTKIGLSDGASLHVSARATGNREDARQFGPRNLPAHVRTSFWQKCILAARDGMVLSRDRKLLLGAEEMSRIRFAVDLHAMLQRLAGLVPVDLLVRDAVAGTGARGIVAAGQRREQALANIDKFIDMARELRTTDLAEFLEFVEGQADDPQGEGEATLEFQSSKAVKVMTIHSAKGLEFPRVFLPQLGERFFAAPPPLLCDGRTWLAVRKSRSTEREGVFLYEHLANLEEERSLAEEKRVLYVAATRCRDALYLSAAVPDPGRIRRSFLAWLCEQCHVLAALESGARFIELPSPDTGEAVRVPLVVHLPRVAPARQPEGPDMGNDGLRDRARGNLAAMSRRAAQICPEGFGFPTGKGLVPLSPRDLPSVGHDSLAVTQFLDFMECPQAFFIKHVARLNRRAAVYAGRSPLDPAARGTLIHAALALVRKHDDDYIQGWLWRRLVHEHALSPTAANVIARQLSRHIARARAAGILDIMESAAHLSFETRRTGSVGPLLLTASYDCELKTEDGVALADFKTDSKMAPETRQRYENQMRLYLLLLGSATPGQAEFVAHLLFTALCERRQVAMTREDMALYRHEIEPRAREYCDFARSYCAQPVIVTPILLEDLATLCARRSSPCAAHVGSKEGKI